VTDLDESLQLASACTRTSVGGCATSGLDPVGVCIVTSHANDFAFLDSIVDFPEVRTCADASCLGAAKTCSCVGNQVCTRELTNVGTTQFDCRKDRVCGRIANVDLNKQVEAKACKTGVTIQGTCDEVGACVYGVFTNNQLFADSPEKRSCTPTTPCADGTLCACKDLFCVLELAEGGVVPPEALIPMECL
jgi:hypothetical protein